MSESKRCICGPATIDGYTPRRKGCAAHPPLRPPEPPPEPEMSADEIDRACAWADYRKDYGVSVEHMAAEHLAFKAGWDAAHGARDVGGVLR